MPLIPKNLEKVVTNTQMELFQKVMRNSTYALAQAGYKNKEMRSLKVGQIMLDTQQDNSKVFPDEKKLKITSPEKQRI